MDGLINQQEDIVSRAEVLSDRLNKYLESYLATTREIGRILTNNQDEEGTLLLEAVARRQELIEKYDVLKKEYEQVLRISSGELNKKPADKLEDLREERVKLLNQIKALEDEQNKLLAGQLEDSKVRLKQVKEGKKLFETYFGPTSSREGIYIDKRE